MTTTNLLSKQDFDLYAQTATYKSLTRIEGKAEQLQLDYVFNGVNKERADLAMAAIKKPNEILYIKYAVDYDTVNFAISAANGGLPFLIASRTGENQYKLAEAQEQERIKESKKIAEYMLSDEYLISEMLSKMESKRRQELQVLAFLIDRASKGQSILKVAQEI
ncbi:MAG: hypothetical protein HRT52_22250 [Colwellia sp.]|nr:hypothetical protein [Colwellia sp.]